MGHVELEPNVSQVSVARRFVGDELAHVSGDVVADLQLIVSELVTNAVVHGPDAPVIVSVECDDRCAAVTVDARGPASDVGPVVGWLPAASDEIGGRGLGIVRSIADRVEVGRVDDRFSVTACRLL